MASPSTTSEAHTRCVVYESVTQKKRQGFREREKEDVCVTAKEIRRGNAAMIEIEIRGSETEKKDIYSSGSGKIKAMYKKIVPLAKL